MTVAHRLRTVIDYDRLIVLDKGELAEFDTPWNLLQDGYGIFADMCLRSGTYEELKAAARAKAERDGLVKPEEACSSSDAAPASGGAEAGYDSDVRE